MIKVQMAEDDVGDICSFKAEGPEGPVQGRFFQIDAIDLPELVVHLGAVAHVDEQDMAVPPHQKRTRG